MKLEKYFQYTKGWYTVNIDTPFSHDSIIQWCEENGTTGRYHPIYSYYCTLYHNPGKLKIANYLVMIKFSLHDDFTEFLLVGDWEVK
jgi:hypothetical protein